MAWYWQQRVGPYPFPLHHFKVWFHGSLATASEYFQTMLNLNSFANEIEALATVDHCPVRLLVSKPSYIQNRSHIDALHRIYEGACFHGLRVGFVTEQELAESDVDRACRMIIIPDAEFVSSAALGALEDAQQSGVKLVRFGPIKTTRNSYGEDHPAESLGFLSKLPVLQHERAESLSKRLVELVEPYLLDESIRVTDEVGEHAFGVIHRQATLGDKHLLLLINARKKGLKITLKDRDGNTVSGRDILNGVAVNGQGGLLSFQGVRLIEIP